MALPVPCLDVLPRYRVCALLFAYFVVSHQSNDAVTVGTTIRPIGFLPPSIKYLRVCLSLDGDYFADFEVSTSMNMWTG